MFYKGHVLDSLSENTNNCSVCCKAWNRFNYRSLFAAFILSTLRVARFLDHEVGRLFGTDMSIVDKNLGHIGCCCQDFCDFVIKYFFTVNIWNPDCVISIFLNIRNPDLLAFWIMRLVGFLAWICAVRVI